MSDMKRPPVTDQFTLLSGLAGLVFIVLFVVSNFALGGIDPPKPGASAEEVSEFFIDKGGNLEWDAGMRYMVFFLFPIFAFGLSRYVRANDDLAGALASIALMGTVWLLATGTVANTFESILIFERDRLASEPELARALNLGMNALFDVAVLPHALLIACFSEAGRRTKTLPIWLSALGYFQALAGLIGAVALARSLERDNVADLAVSLAYLAFGLWYLVTSVVLVVAWARRAATRGAHNL